MNVLFMNNIRIDDKPSLVRLTQLPHLPHLPCLPHWLHSCIIVTYFKYFFDYEKAKKAVKKFNLKNSVEWGKYIKKNNISKHIPKSPEHHYKKNKSWKGWGDFLDSKNIYTHNRKYIPFNEARSFVRKLKLHSHENWLKFRKSKKRPHQLPYQPRYYYLNKGWKGWKDFLGTG